MNQTREKQHSCVFSRPDFWMAWWYHRIPRDLPDLPYLPYDDTIVFMIYPIQDRVRGQKAPPPLYQLFPFNFYNRRK